MENSKKQGRRERRKEKKQNGDRKKIEKRKSQRKRKTKRGKFLSNNAKSSVFEPVGRWS